MSSKRNLYLGRAGQLAVMSEFLSRGYNVAIPEVDVGDDLFVVRDSTGDFRRIQVKTCSATPTGYGYSASYNLRLDQLETPTNPETWYVFANRLENRWVSFLIISREKMYDLYNIEEIGTKYKNALMLYMAYREEQAICSNQNLWTYVDNWSDWPKIQD